MTDQVTSIEQSKRLIELGVPVEKASMVWRWGWVCGTVDEENYELKIWQECKMDKILAYQEFPESFIPAFTVADLLGMIPAEITYGRLYVSHPKIPSVKNDFNVFYKRVGREKGAIKSFRHPNLTCACVMMVEWLLSNGYKLNI